MVMEQEIRAQAEAAKAASYHLAALRTDARNKALCAMADALMAHRDKILHENAADVEDAKTSGMRASYLDRLRLDEARIASMAEGLRLTAALPDPLGREDYSVRRPNGLEIRRMRVPLGVVGMIYEARPNVTADAIGLCLKSGNAVLLRGGSDALRSNLAIAEVLSRAAYAAGSNSAACDEGTRRRRCHDTSDRTARCHHSARRGWSDSPHCREQYRPCHRDGSRRLSYLCGSCSGSLDGTAHCPKCKGFAPLCVQCGRDPAHPRRNCDRLSSAGGRNACH